MATIIIPRRHYTQPQGRVTVADEWRKNGLRALVTSSPLNFADNKFATALSVSSAVTPFGVALNSQKAASSYIEFPFELSGAVSVFALVSRDSGVDLSGPGTVAALASNKSSPTQTQFWEATLGNGFGPFADKEKPRFIDGAQGIGQIYVDGALRSGNNPANFALSSGVFYSAVFATTQALASGSGVTRIFNTGGEFGMAARAPVLALFAKELGGMEASALYENPWQLFRADPIRIYSFPSGPITINSITASLVTSSGARITLGLTR